MHCRWLISRSAPWFRPVGPAPTLPCSTVGTPCSARVSRTLGGPDSQSSEDAVRHHQGLLGPTDVSFLLNDVIVPALGPMLRNVSSILPCWCGMSGRSV